MGWRKNGENGVIPKYADHQTKEQASREGQTTRDKVCFTKVGSTGNNTGSKDDQTKSNVRLDKA